MLSKNNGGPNDCQRSFFRIFCQPFHIHLFCLIFSATIIIKWRNNAIFSCPWQCKSIYRHRTGENYFVYAPFPGNLTDMSSALDIYQVILTYWRDIVTMFSN